MARNSKGGEINCGECKKFFAEDKLIADLKNNRYLCEGCYEPRDDETKPPKDDIVEIDDQPEDIDDIDDDDIEDGDDKECESPRALRGEARITRERPPKETNKKILICLNVARDWLNIGLKATDADFAYWLELNGYSPE
ncbi:11201_t:CDS:2 [Ambispora gerdemannii]|uniref:11201_t:CDS:1 n=1 Tax=Ambispora gerdemannii TaxID=144530 RepID=A0A9N8W6D3_9GLOM|nr:11201_t:CDS:2 [Ambispora gerdemannii]